MISNAAEGENRFFTDAFDSAGVSGAGGVAYALDGARIGAWGGEVVEIWGEVVCAPSVKTPFGRFEGRRSEGFVRRAKGA